MAFRWRMVQHFGNHTATEEYLFIILLYYLYIIINNYVEWVKTERNHANGLVVWISFSYTLPTQPSAPATKARIAINLPLSLLSLVSLCGRTVLLMLADREWGWTRPNYKEREMRGCFHLYCSIHASYGWYTSTLYSVLSQLVLYLAFAPSWV